MAASASHSKPQVSPTLTSPIQVRSSTVKVDHKKSEEKNNVEGAIINALNKINTPEASNEINPTCRTISDLLSKMPLRERTQLEIALLQKTYEAAYDYL